MPQRSSSTKTTRAKTPRKAAPRKATARKSVEQQVLEQAINAVVSIDENNCVTFFNAAAEALWGYSADEVLGQNVKMLVPLEMQPNHDGFVNANRTTGVDKIVGTSREVEVHRKDGSIKYGSLSLSRVEVGGKKLYTAFVTDVTAGVEQRQEIEQVFSQAINAVVSIDEHNVVTRFNPAAERLWGYAPEEVIGKNVKMLVPLEMQSNHDGFVNANRTTGLDKIVGTSREVPVFRKDGSQLWGQLSLSKVEVGGRITYTAFVTDVTEEVARREEIRTLSLVANESSNSVVITDAFGRVEYVNPGFEKMTGHTLDEVRGKSPGDVLQGELTDKETVARIGQRLTAQEPTYEEIVNYRKDGTPYWISLSIDPVFDSEGQLERFIAIQALIDDTKREQLESQYKLDAISLAQAVIEFEPDGTILAANENFCAATGYRLEEIQGRHHSMFCDNEFAQSAEYQGMWPRLASGEPISGKFERVRKDGSVLWLNAFYNPILNEYGKVSKIVKFASDVTELETERVMVDAVLKEASRVMGNVASGNLTDEVSGQYANECLMLQESINKGLTQLRETLAQVVTSTKSIELSAQTVTQGNLSLSQRTEDQAASLEQTAASMEEMTSTIRSNADNLKEADSLAGVAREKADSGGQVVSQAIHAMDEINTSSKQIADIIGVIDEIAFQTNLLALNAAVEAARAGEQGRGFAVVAAEVRNLAQRSAEAAKEIKELIKDSVTKVEEGSVLVNQSGETLTEIVDSVSRVNDIIGQISLASQEQAEGVDQVNQAVTRMDQMTQKNAALAEEASSASMSMSSDSETLTSLISFFQLGAEGATGAPRTAGPRVSVPAANQERAPAPTQRAAGADFDTGEEWEEF
ncbi:MAG: PAS domain S-box protein [Pseudomonadota bacterium]